MAPERGVVPHKVLIELVNANKITDIDFSNNQKQAPK
jgi:hypothetical protein